ncbi:MAG: TIGR02996 domain-containing protein [Myxococcota bacterium]
MAMAERGSRRLVVAGQPFHLTIRVGPGPGFRATQVSVVVEHAEAGGRPLITEYDPHALSGPSGPEVRPRDLRAVVETGLEQGWSPTEPGDPFRLDPQALFGVHPEPAWALGFGAGRKLLDAVLDAPDLLEPRLVLADWLIERDDPRGAFIRAQCCGEPTPTLLTSNWRAWSAPAFVVAYEWSFSRGFVDRVRLRNALALGDWWALHAREPVRTVVLAGHLLSEFSPQLLQPSHRDWQIVGPLSHGAAIALARLPRRALRSLDLSRAVFDAPIRRMIEGSVSLSFIEVRLPGHPPCASGRAS